MKLKALVLSLCAVAASFAASAHATTVTVTITGTVASGSVLDGTAFGYSTGTNLAGKTFTATFKANTADGTEAASVYCEGSSGPFCYTEDDANATSSPITDVKLKIGSTSTYDYGAASVSSSLIGFGVQNLAIAKYFGYTTSDGNNYVIFQLSPASGDTEWPSTNPDWWGTFSTDSNAANCTASFSYYDATAGNYAKGTLTEATLKVSTP